MHGREPRIHQAKDVPARSWDEVRELMLETINREISHLSLTAVKRKLQPAESLHIARMSIALMRLAPPPPPKERPIPIEELSDEELTRQAGLAR